MVDAMAEAQTLDLVPRVGVGLSRRRHAGQVRSGGQERPGPGRSDRSQDDSGAAGEGRPGAAPALSGDQERLARARRRPLISIVDDDASVGEALESLLRSAGFDVESFGSARQFLASNRLADADCLILDVRMPGMSGLELQRELVAAGSRIAIIFITAHGGEAARAQALGAGAVSFLHKPFTEDALLDAVRAALR